MFELGNTYRYTDPTGRDTVEYEVSESNWDHKVQVIYTDEAQYAHLFSWNHNSILPIRTKGYLKEFTGNSEEDVVNQYVAWRGSSAAEVQGSRQKTSRTTDAFGILYARNLGDTRGYGVFGFNPDDEYLNCWAYDEAISNFMNKVESEQLWASLYSHLMRFDADLWQQYFISSTDGLVPKGIPGALLAPGGAERDPRLPWAIEGPDGHWYPPDQVPAPSN